MPFVLMRKGQNMADQKPAPWVCPWGICNHDQAQECRADRKAGRGCGWLFPGNVTPEQAKQEIPHRGAKAGLGYQSRDGIACEAGVINVGRTIPAEGEKK